jgi:23S rRNA (guanosine2251-2'-O)-methyltransferase
MVRGAGGALTVFGAHAVLEALQGGQSVRVVYLKRGKFDAKTDAVTALCKARGIPVHWTGSDFFRNENRRHWIAAQIPAAAVMGEDDLLERAAGGPLLLLHKINDPRNLGAILRTACGLGFACVGVTVHESAPLSETVYETSAGAVAHLSIGNISNAAAFMQKAREAGYWIYGATMEGRPVGEVKFDARTLLVMGTEGKGLSDYLKKECDFLVGIPMKGKIDSLNVSTAAAILMYEVARSISK